LVFSLYFCDENKHTKAMKKTLLFLLSVLAFSVSSFANYDGDGGDNGHCVITDMTWSTNGVNRPRIYATQFIEINFEQSLVTVKATSELPVHVRFVRIADGSMEEQTYNTYYTMSLCSLTLEYVVDWGNGNVMLYVQDMQQF